MWAEGATGRHLVTCYLKRGGQSHVSKKLVNDLKCPGMLNERVRNALPLENPCPFCYTCLRSCAFHCTGDERHECMKIHLCLTFSRKHPPRTTQPHPGMWQQIPLQLYPFLAD